MILVHDCAIHRPESNSEYGGLWVPPIEVSSDPSFYVHAAIIDQSKNSLSRGNATEESQPMNSENETASDPARGAWDDDWDAGVESTEIPEEDEADIIQYEISYYPADITLKGYYDKWLAGQLKVPEFQRNYVWDRVKASKLIESFLFGLPVPGVFLYKQRRTNRLMVIDGQQRIMTAINYFRNEFDDRAFRLTNVAERWNGKRYQDLDEAEQFQLHDSVLRATIIQQLHPEDDSSIYHIFERLNTGGVNLTPMEVRKCVHFGHYFEMLEKLNKLEAWRTLLSKPRLDKRLRDVELVLRVIALRHGWRSYEKPMKQFLNDHIQRMRRLGEAEQEETIENDAKEFESACAIAVESLPDKPFHLRGRLNYAAMDSMIAGLMETGASDPEVVHRAYLRLLDDEDYLGAVSTSTSDEKVLSKRFKLVKQALSG